VVPGGRATVGRALSAAAPEGAAVGRVVAIADVRTALGRAEVRLAMGATTEDSSEQSVDVGAGWATLVTAGAEVAWVVGAGAWYDEAAEWVAVCTGAAVECATLLVWTAEWVEVCTGAALDATLLE